MSIRQPFRFLRDSAWPWVAALAAAGALAAFAGSEPPPPTDTVPPPDRTRSAEVTPPPTAVDRARRIADELTRDLSSRLVAELRAGGPAQAVRVCAEVAPAIAAARSDANTRVRRVSLRARNPADTPDDFERRRLEELETLHRKGERPKEIVEVVTEAGGRALRYLRPILVGEPCLACHGPAGAIDPAVRSVIAERYPDDQATGYRAGDLRGAVSVTIHLD